MPKISSGYLTPQSKKPKKNTTNHSGAKEKPIKNNPSSVMNDTLFKSLMKDPEKKKMILELLALNKDAIKDYKKKGQVPSPVGKIKKNAACESPTALFRRRALEQMTKGSSTFSSNSSPKPSSEESFPSSSRVPYDKVFNGVIAFVEVISNGKDRSEGVKSVLRSMGATVKDRMSSDVTHVVFKGGSFTTYNKANLIKAHIVSVLWVEFSRKSLRKQDEKLYHAIKTRLYDDESSFVCSQIEKEYEEIIREEYKKSIAEGTPLPSTATIINRRRTLMTPSCSSTNTSFHTAQPNVSPQQITDKENELQNKNTSDMELTMLSEHEEEVFKINKRNVKKVSNVSSKRSIVDKRRTICSISTGSDRTPSGICPVAEVSASREIGNVSGNLSDLDESIVFGKNSVRSRIQTEKVSCSQEECSSIMDKLHVSSEESKKSSSRMSALYLSSSNDKESSSVMSKLNISTDKNENQPNNAVDKVSVRTRASFGRISRSNSSLVKVSSTKLNISNEQTINPSVEMPSSTMSALHLSSENIKEPRCDRESVDSISKMNLPSNKNADQVSVRTNRSFGKKSRNNSSVVDSSSNTMSALHLSSENVKGPGYDSSTSLSKLNLLIKKNADQSNTSDGQVSVSSKRNIGKKSRSNSSLVNSSSTVMSELNMSSEQAHGDKSSNTMSALHLSSENVKGPECDSSMSRKKNSDQSNTSDGKVSVRSKRSFGKKSRNKSSSTVMTELSMSSEQAHNRLSGDKSSNTMSALHVSSEKENRSIEKGKESNEPRNRKSSLCPSIIKESKLLNQETNSFISSEGNDSHSLNNFVNDVINQLDRSKLTSSNSEDSEVVVSPRKRTRSLFLPKQTAQNEPTARSEKSANFNNIKSFSTSYSADESDAPKRSRKKRKLWDPDDYVVLQFDDEEERAERRNEIIKKKEVPNKSNGDNSSVSDDQLPVTKKKDLNDSSPAINAVTRRKSIRLASKCNISKECMSTSISLDEDDYISLAKPKKVRKTKKKSKPVVEVNSSDDEQRDLLKEIEARQLPPKLCSQTRRRSTRLSIAADLNKVERGTPVTPKNRRSTMDFQPISQRSTAKKQHKTDLVKRPTIVCTKLHRDEVQIFTEAVKNLGRFFVENTVSNSTTHLVAGEPKRTINMMKAVSRGCWVVNYSWVLRSIEKGKWLPEEDFEVLDFAPVVQKSRLQRQAFGPRYSLDVFENCGPIFVSARSNPNNFDLRELIAVCKGDVVGVKRKARIVVGEEGACDNDVVHVTENWVLDCITANRKVPFKEKYLLKEKRRVSLAV